MAVTANILTQAQIVDTGSTGLSAPSMQLNQQYSSALNSPTKEYNAQRTTTGETLDLTSGLTNPFGTALVFATVQYLYIQNTSNTLTLTIGGGSNAFGADVYTLAPLGCVGIVSSWTIDGTHKNLKVLPSSGTVTYSIIICGT